MVFQGPLEFHHLADQCSAGSAEETMWLKCDHSVPGVDGQGEVLPEASSGPWAVLVPKAGTACFVWKLLYLLTDIGVGAVRHISNEIDQKFQRFRSIGHEVYMARCGRIGVAVRSVLTIPKCVCKPLEAQLIGPGIGVRKLTTVSGMEKYGLGSRIIQEFLWWVQRGIHGKEGLEEHPVQEIYPF